MKAQAWGRRNRQAVIVPDDDGNVTLPLPVLVDLLHEAGWRLLAHPDHPEPDDTGHPRTTEL